MGLGELIEKHSTTGNEDADYLTQAIFDDVLRDVDLLNSIVMPALRSAIVHYLRMQALHAEKDSLLDAKPSANPTADRLAFLNERFFVPTIGFVTWAEATVEHHRMRISYLTDKAQGILDTAARHEEAIHQIEAAGVKNLGQVHKPPRRRKAS
jgi:hypothetical protein